MSLTSPNRGYPLEKIDGNSATIADWSAGILDVGNELDELRKAAASVDAVAGSGSAMDAVRRDGRDLAATIASDVLLAEKLAGVLRNYSDAFRITAERANALIDQIESAHATWLTRSHEADAAGNAALWTSRGGTDSEIEAANADAHDAVSARDTARDALDELWEEYEGYYSAWDDAYDAALAELTTVDSTRLTTQGRDFLELLLAADSAAEVNRIWLENSAFHQELIDASPDVIGNLDGIPWDVRADVNETRLDRMLAVEPPGTRRDELAAIRRALNDSGVPSAGLISFDPYGAAQVLGAIAYGDLTAATDVTSLVPGMDGNVLDMQAWGESAKSLNAAVGPGAATVVWFGYDTPSLSEEPRMGRARDGAATLRSYLLALGALSPNAEVNVIAHSYGSTTAALAIGSQSDNLGVTSFIAVGSAGFPNDPTVLQNLADGDVRIYATLSEDDAIARIGRATAPNHSVSPEQLPDVTVFDSDGGVSPTGEELPAAPGHDALGPGSYLQPGSESFYNVSEIIATGEPGTERDGAGSTQGFWDQKNWWISDEYSLIDF